MARSFAFHRFAMCMAFIGLSACASSKRNSDEAELHLRIGTGHLAKGNYPAALRELLVAEKLDPQNPVTQNNLGLAYFVRERNVEAERHLQKALALSPNYSEARNNLGRVQIEMGLYDQAIGNLQNVIKDLTYSYPDKAWVNLGLAQFRKGRYQEARASLGEAIKLNRQHCLAQTLLGRTLLELGDFSAASQRLDYAVQLCRPTEYDEPHYFSALAYYRLGFRDKAIARMEEVIRLYPTGTYAGRARERLKEMK